MKYRIQVKDYMLKRATEKFDFMRKFNNNMPMPFDTAIASIIQETTGMYKMNCKHEGKEWTGWIIKSAIVSMIEINETANNGLTVKVENDRTVLYNASDDLILGLTRTFSNRLRKGKIEFLGLDFYAICDAISEMGLTYSADDNGFYSKYKIRDVVDYTGEIPDIAPFTDSKLFEHQKIGYEYGMRRNRYLLADEMGLGKTLQSLLVACGKEQLYGTKHCLIICGVNSVKENWLEEIKKHTHKKGYILSGTAENKLKEIKSLDRGHIPSENFIGLSKREQKKLQKINDINDSYFIITNVETFRNKQFAEAVSDLCERGVIGGSIFDEIHKCVNMDGKQSQGCLMAQPFFRIAVTGTPLINKPVDALFTFRWLGKTKMEPYAWNAIYTRKEDAYKVVDKNLQLLKENFQNIMIRRRKEDVLDLPEKILVNEYLEMTPEMSNLYKQQLDAEEENGAVKVLKLRQITTIPEMLGVRSVKMERLNELLTDIIVSKRKVVVFSNWKQTLDCIEKAIDCPHYRIDGDVPVEERQRIKTLWQSEQEGTDIKVPLLIGTMGSCGTGLDFNTATNVIFFDEPWTSVTKNQAMDRCHRIGTKGTVNVITLMVENTVDTEVHDVVLGKAKREDVVMNYEKNTNPYITREERNEIESTEPEVQAHEVENNGIAMLEL